MHKLMNNLTRELIIAMEPLSAGELEEINREWQQELDKIGASERVKSFCRAIFETVIERKRERERHDKDQNILSDAPGA